MLYAAFIVGVSAFWKPPGMPCPPDVPYHFDKAIKFDVPPKGWHYFRTGVPHTKDIPVVFDIHASSTVLLHVQDRSQCPELTSPPNATIPARTATRVPIVVDEDVHVVTSGFYSEDGATVRVKLIGQHKRRPLNPAVKTVIIFVVMAAVVVVFFVNCVLPPLKPKTE
jgi:hypothetical protein